MPSYTKALELVRESLVAEYGCTQDDLLHPDVHLTALPPLANLPATVRRYPPNDPPLKIVSLGMGAVVAAQPDLYAPVAALLPGLGRDDLFNVATLGPLLGALSAHGLRLLGPHLRLLCGADTLRLQRPPPGYAIQIEPWPDLSRLRRFDTGQWPNATGARVFDGRSPTAAIAVALHGAETAGVASLSAEATHLRQIGIDVAAQHRGRGVGAALVAALAASALEAGCAPWYGVAPATIGSIHTALAAGFRHAWIEMYALPA